MRKHMTPPTTPAEQRLYTQHSWNAMIGRCKPNSPVFKYYMGSGITVCDEWQGRGGLDRFIADMGYRPYGLTIEREDNAKGYEPGNCIWVTMAEQTKNRRPRNSVPHMEPLPCITWAQRGRASHNGLTANLDVWAHIMDLPATELVLRLRRAWPDAQIVGAEGRHAWITVNGVSRRIAEVAAEVGLSYLTVKKRLDAGATLDQALGKASFLRHQKNSPTLTYNGTTLALAQWSNRTGIAVGTLKARIKKGLEPAQVLGFKPYRVKDIEAFNRKVNKLMRTYNKKR